MERIVDPENMNQAWKPVKANKGAPGIDRIPIKAFPDGFIPRWEEIRQARLDGTYQPQPVQRVSIPKPSGGERRLGIPTVLDRLIQQAIAPVITPIFDPEFSESSFGFRPGRSAHGALKQVQAPIREGYTLAVDRDRAKFFDRVQHDVLMARVARRIRDRRLLALIGRYLRAGVLGGTVQPSELGTPQGGPLSPLLANILWDDRDQELERRGHRFAR
jgi:RNA-directed DNA polymerase